MKTIKMEDMNWPDIKEAIEKGFRTAVVGIGSTEQHGPHLPTKTDTLIGDAIAYKVALKLGKALQVKIIMEKGMPALSKKGVLGDPSKASAKRGEVYLEKIVDFLVQEIKATQRI